MESWIRLYRKSMNSRAFQNADLWKVWSWCLMKANHKKTWVPVFTGKGETEVEVFPGQFIFGRKSAAIELEMPESSIRNRMKKLKNMRNLDMQPATHYSIVTIINWGIYQPKKIKKDRQKDNERTAKGQPEDTDKNDKNVKKKEIYKESVLLTAIEYKNLCVDFGREIIDSKIEDLDNFSGTNAKKFQTYTDHNKVLRSWLKRAGIKKISETKGNNLCTECNLKPRERSGLCLDCYDVVEKKHQDQE